MSAMRCRLLLVGLVAMLALSIHLRSALVGVRVEAMRPAPSEASSDVEALCPIPGTPVLVSPVDGDTLHDSTPTYDWNPSDNADDYELQVATAASFAPVKIVQSCTTYGWNQTACTPDTPLADGTYYWHVRARAHPTGCFEYGSWSATRSFKMCHIPGLPALVSPADGAATTDTTPTFNWSAATYGSGYDLVISTRSDFYTHTQAALTGYTYWTCNELPEGVYYWRVRAGNLTAPCAEWGSWSAIRDLTIDLSAPEIHNVRESADPIHPIGCYSTTVTIRADVTDPTLDRVDLIHRRQGEAAWTTTPMTLESGDTYKLLLGPFSFTGAIEYYVRAQDELSHATQSAPHTVQIVECAVPVISNLRAAFDPLNMSGCPQFTLQTVRADVTDASGLAWVELYWRLCPSGCGAWSHKPMTLESGSTYVAEIGPFGRGRVDYSVHAADIHGNTTEVPSRSFSVVECTAPAISNVSVAPQPIRLRECYSDEGTMVRADVSDSQSGVLEVRGRFLLNEGTWVHFSMPCISGTSADGTYAGVIGPLYETGTLRIEVKAFDVDANLTTMLLDPIQVLPCDTDPPDIRNVRRLLSGQRGALLVRAEITDPSGVQWAQLCWQSPSAGADAAGFSCVPMTRPYADTWGATVEPIEVGDDLHYYIRSRDNRGNEGQSSTFETTFPSLRLIWLPIAAR